MGHLQKAGGIAALIEALAYVIGFAVMATLLNPGQTEGWSSAQKLAFVLERKSFFQAWFLFIYVLFGIVLVVLTVALHERLKGGAADLMKVASPFGLIWAGLVIASGMVASVGLEAVATIYARDVAQANATWLVIDAIQNGLGGGVEVVGGVWVFLLSIASLRSATLPKSLAYFGILLGLLGMLTVIPVLEDLTALFGLSQIVWFIWLGLSLLLRKQGEHLVAAVGTARAQSAS
jgi:hypothetical protein